jgi:glutathione S-transferase
MFLAEKSFDLQIVEMELHKDNRTKEFRVKNPMGNLPVLELEDGTCISESVAICRYIEQLQPEPSLFGNNPLDMAVIEMWNRRAEFAFYMPIEFAGGFLGAEVAEGAKKRVEKTMQLFNERLSVSKYLAGEWFSIADITAKVALDFGIRFSDIVIPEEVEHFIRWNQALETRESTKV